MKQSIHFQQRRRQNSASQLFGCLYDTFFRRKICFVVIGFAFGVILTLCLQWMNSGGDHHFVASPPIQITSRDISEAIEPLSIRQEQPSLPVPAAQEAISIDNEIPTAIIQSNDAARNQLLHGLQKGLNLVAKNPPNEHKKVRLLYIVGNEGSGHHLWENIMKEMSTRSNMVNTNYVENEVLLVKCLHSCLMEIYHKKKGQLNSGEEVYFAAAQKKTAAGLYVEYACDAFRAELEKTVKDDNLVPDGSLIYLRSYSYPFMGPELVKVPNIVTLINAAQSVLEVDMKLIVMKRQWVNCVVSSCVHRYGQCAVRAQMLPAILSMIQTQILSIDPKFWIMIDYEDFVSRPLEYVDIVHDWLLIEDKEMVKASFEKVIKPSKTSTANSGWDELNKNSKDLAKLVHNLLYSDYAKGMWPIYNSPYFLVTPENRVFLDSKYK